MTTPSSIRVLCVDDHRIVREGIALILAREPDIEVVASAANADEAVSEFKRHRPDVTLMDLRLGERNGIDAIKEIRRDYPDARIVFSGGSGALLFDEGKEAEFAAQLLESLGVPRARLLLEDRSRNTV